MNTGPGVGRGSMERICDVPFQKEEQSPSRTASGFSGLHLPASEWRYTDSGGDIQGPVVLACVRLLYLVPVYGHTR